MHRRASSPRGGDPYREAARRGQILTVGLFIVTVALLCCASLVSIYSDEGSLLLREWSSSPSSKDQMKPGTIHGQSDDAYLGGSESELDDAKLMSANHEGLSATWNRIPGSALDSPDKIRQFRKRFACISKAGRWAYNSTPRLLPWPDEASECDVAFAKLDEKNLAMEWADNVANQMESVQRRIDRVPIMAKWKRKVESMERYQGMLRKRWRVRDTLKYEWLVPGQEEEGEEGGGGDGGMDGRNGATCGAWDRFDPERFCRIISGRNVLVVGDSNNLLLANSIWQNARVGAKDPAIRVRRGQLTPYCQRLRKASKKPLQARCWTVDLCSDLDSSYTAEDSSGSAVSEQGSGSSGVETNGPDSTSSSSQNGRREGGGRRGGKGGVDLEGGGQQVAQADSQQQQQQQQPTKQKLSQQSEERSQRRRDDMTAGSEPVNKQKQKGESRQRAEGQTEERLDSEKRDVRDGTRGGGSGKGGSVGSEGRDGGGEMGRRSGAGSGDLETKKAVQQQTRGQQTRGQQTREQQTRGQQSTSQKRGATAAAAAASVAAVTAKGGAARAAAAAAAGAKGASSAAGGTSKGRKGGQRSLLSSEEDQGEQPSSSTQAELQAKPFQLHFIQDDSLILNFTGAGNDWTASGPANDWIVDQSFHESWMGEIAAQNISIVMMNRGAHFVPHDQFERQMRSTLLALRQTHPDLLILFRSSPSSHPNCWEHWEPSRELMKPPLADGDNDKADLSEVQNGIAKGVVEMAGGVFIDVDYLTALRPDGHVGRRDCTRYCQPGPVDTWTQVLYNMLLDLLPES
ncbi:hypothetical protein CLOP_g20361 [Closterium sp. NIES-67]|nr:hypothetical protein CLOP_g20361 [Closterium sp. NIES-67]